VGQEKGIIVESTSQGTITELTDSIMASIRKDAGAQELPNIFAAYADTAYEADSLGYVADLSPYFTDEELDQFIDGYIEEGRFSSDGTLKLFPVAKAVEVFTLNKTDWDKFAIATGASEEELATIEGVCEVAKQYYEWTDAQTPEANDGKAFFGRDAMANYMIIGYRQLAGEMFSVKDGEVTLSFERDALKKLWDCYYIPYIHGYFSSAGRFRSDDIKTGDIICCVGSSASANYFPEEVILNDEESYPIEMETLVCPGFADGENYATQQGAGMVVVKSDEKSEQASVEFLKWFTQDEQNIRFSVASGYLPVTKSTNDIAKITENITVEENVEKTLISSFELISKNNMYTTKPFEKASDARSILENAIQDIAVQDRETVKNNLDKGMTLEEATETFCSEDYFDKWYEELKRELEDVISDAKEE
jgi:multiple sugar transport system substrate-binding protein